MSNRQRCQQAVCVLAGISIWLSMIGGLPAQTAKPPTSKPAAGPTTAPSKPPLKQEELDQILAPIALYPDPLLTQVLMASTYPLEIVQADRWVKANKTLKDAALTAELEKQTWDASVKSLVNFPDVLAMMSEKLDLTIKLGDAFIAQQADVMNSIQNLRVKAKKQGQLESNDKQKVTVQAPPPPQQQETTVVVQQTTPPPTEIVVIEPAQPQVIYVPTYSPTVVYGGWPYPAYPPAPYYPPGYVASNVVSFGLGVAAGAAWGYAWGHSNWGHNDVDIDVNRNTNINNNIDRSKYKSEIDNRQSNRQSNRQTGEGGKGSWQHNPQHRQGVPYRDQGTANKYGASNQAAAKSREDYRGRAESGRQDLNNGAASDYRGSGSGDRAANRTANGASAQDRSANSAAARDQSANSAGARDRSANGASAQDRSASGAGAQDRSAAAQNRSAGASDRSAARPSTFDGVDQGGSSARQSSQRGASSRSASSAGSGYSGSSSGAARSSGGGSGGSRSSGGGSRGGGGGRGGGGRR